MMFFGTILPDSMIAHNQQQRVLQMSIVSQILQKLNERFVRTSNPVKIIVTCTSDEREDKFFPIKFEELQRHKCSNLEIEPIFIDFEANGTDLRHRSKCVIYTIKILVEVYYFLYIVVLI